MVEVVLHFIW